MARPALCHVSSSLHRLYRPMFDLRAQENLGAGLRRRVPWGVETFVQSLEAAEAAGIKGRKREPL